MPKILTRDMFCWKMGPSRFTPAEMESRQRPFSGLMEEILKLRQAAEARMQRWFLGCQEECRKVEMRRCRILRNPGMDREGNRQEAGDRKEE